MKIGIIGAGFAGLAAAYELTGAGHSVTVFEAAPKAGGLAAGFKADHWEWHLEHFYHHIFETDSEIQALADEIGFGDKVFFRNPVTAQWCGDRAFPLDGSNPVEAALNVLRFPAMPLISRLRYGMALAYLKYGTDDWRHLEQVTAADWVRRWMGETAYKNGIQPLLRGKFGPYAEDVNAAWLWARFKARSFQLGYFEGGFQAFADALVSAVEGKGGTVHLGTPVKGVFPREGGTAGWEIRLEDDTADFDRVIATVPPSAMQFLVPDLPDEYLAALRELKGLGAIVMVVALDRPLTENLYWVNLDKREFPMLALVEHTNYIDSEYYGGDHIVYLGDYLVPDHKYFSYSKEEMFEVYEATLKRFNPDYDRSWVRDTWISKAKYAQPVVPTNYSQHIPSLRTPLPNLYFASMSQVYPWDRGTNFAVEIGQTVGRLAADDLQPALSDALTHMEGETL